MWPFRKKSLPVFPDSTVTVRLDGQDYVSGGIHVKFVPRVEDMFPCPQCGALNMSYMLPKKLKNGDQKCRCYDCKFRFIMR